MIVLGLGKQIFVQRLSCIFKQTQYTAMKQLSDHRTGVFADVFDVDFSSFPLIKSFRLLVKVCFP